MSQIRYLFLLILLAACSGSGLAQEPDAATDSTKSSFQRGVDAYGAKRYEDAAMHWSKAIEEGHFDARNNLGHLLFNGLGVEQDRERAVRLWREAAQAGHSESAWHLGMAYEVGAGVATNRIEALGWYRCALASSAARQATRKDDVELRIAKRVRESLDTLAARLSAEQLKRAELRGTELVAQYAAKPH